MTAEYLAASLKDSAHARAATEMCVSYWLATDPREAALAYADLSTEAEASASMDEQTAHLGLSKWLVDHGDFGNAIKTLNEVISKPGCGSAGLAWSLVSRGLAKGQLGDERGAMRTTRPSSELEGVPKEIVAVALLKRGVIKGQLGDAQGAIADYAVIIETGRSAQGNSRHGLSCPRCN